MTKERIEDFREVVLPFVCKRLLETNYEGLGESDAEEFAKDFDEILNLAIKALEQEPTTMNNLGDCISRIKVKLYIQAHIHEIITESGEDKNKNTNRVLRSIIHGVNCMPSVTPQEPKTGYWIEDAEQHHVEKTYHCSECGHRAWGEYEKTEYCGECGTKMDKEQKDGDD